MSVPPVLELEYPNKTDARLTSNGTQNDVRFNMLIPAHTHSRKAAAQGENQWSKFVVTYPTYDDSAVDSVSTMQTIWFGIALDQK